MRLYNIFNMTLRLWSSIVGIKTVELHSTFNIKESFCWTTNILSQETCLEEMQTLFALPFPIKQNCKSWRTETTESCRNYDRWRFSFGRFLQVGRRALIGDLHEPRKRSKARRLNKTNKACLFRMNVIKTVASEKNKLDTYPPIYIGIDLVTRQKSSLSYC